jgi:hypothetical protein
VAHVLTGVRHIAVSTDHLGISSLPDAIGLVVTYGLFGTFGLLSQVIVLGGSRSQSQPEGED